MAVRRSRKNRTNAGNEEATGADDATGADEGTGEPEEGGAEEPEEGAGGDGEPENGEPENGEPENGDPQRPELTMAEKGALFLAYQDAADIMKQVKESEEIARENLDLAITDIYNKCGPGPFDWKDNFLKIVRRKGRYYMISQSAEAEKIEA